MTLRVFVVLAATVATLLPSAAVADVGWVRSGTDPPDIEWCVEPPDPEERHCTGFDVRSSTVRIFRSDGGRRFLRITLRAHSRPFGAWMSGVALDTRGGGRVDRIAYLNYPLGAFMPTFRRCGIRRAEPDSESRRGVYRTRSHGEVATCRFPLEWLAPTKRPIRWHVSTNWMFPEPVSMVDRAPGAHGWYP